MEETWESKERRSRRNR